MNWLSENMISIFSMLVTGGAIYGAIKGDIRGIHEKICNLSKDLDYHRARLDTFKDSLQKFRDSRFD